MRNNIIGTKISIKITLWPKSKLSESSWNKILIVFALPDESP